MRCAFFVLLAVVAADLDAQRRGTRTRGYAHTRNSEKLRQVFAPAVATARASTVRVFVDDKAVAYGTVVGADGWIVTKASELKGDGLFVAFGDESPRIAARKIGVDDPNDLALLRVEKKGLAKVAFAIDNGTKSGSFVVTPAPGAKTPLAYGIMSVARHARKARTFLGVQTQAHPKGVRLTQILPNTAAAGAGLKRGDVVVVIDGDAAKDLNTFRAAILRQKPGSNLKLKVLRGETEMDVVAKLSVDSDRHGPISAQERSRLWGPLSQVRLGFDEVIQHDSVIRPEHCGGPLCNVNGDVVGVNIARVGRFETLALTAKVVVASITKMRKAYR